MALKAPPRATYPGLTRRFSNVVPEVIQSVIPKVIRKVITFRATFRISFGITSKWEVAPKRRSNPGLGSQKRSRK